MQKDSYIPPEAWAKAIDYTKAGDLEKAKQLLRAYAESEAPTRSWITRKLFGE